MSEQADQVPDKIIFYGRPTCGAVAPVREVLERAGADYEYVDIADNAEAQQRVRDINQGNESVPTLVFPNGGTLTEPDMRELQIMLEAVGYELPPPSPRERARQIMANPLVQGLGLVLLIVGFVSDLQWLAGIGVAVIFVGLLAGFLRGRM